LAPAQAEEQRRRLHQHLARAVRASFSPASRPVLREEDLPPIEGMIELLQARAPELAGEVRQDFEKRRQDLRLVLGLHSPFADLTDVLPEGRFEKHTAHLECRPAADNPESPILSRLPCARSGQVEAELQHPSWDFAEPVGLILNGGKEE